MERTDVVVVGAGPSGSSAAYFLAKRGIDVILVDKSNFPREKTCGDGLGPRSIQMLEKMGLFDWLISNGHYRCDRLRLFSNDGTYFEAGIPNEDTSHPHFYIASRKNLDQKLIETAEKAGARVFTSCKATDLIYSGATLKGVKVDTDVAEISCKVVICADGTHGTFAARTGIKCVKPDAFAVRAYYDGVKGTDDCINIYFDERISEGYAWVFPTSERSANIGIGLSCQMMKQRSVDIKSLLAWFLKEKNTHPIDLSSAVAVTDIRGAHLRMGYGRYNVLKDGILLTGDAAALISPLTGEGIAYALESGEIAAETVRGALDKGDVSSRALALYKDKLDKMFLMDHRICEFLRDSLARPALMNRAIRKGSKNSAFAARFASIIMGTSRASTILSPKIIGYYLWPG